MTNDKVIIFSTVSDQDEGDYYCVAENKAGTVQGNPVSISVGQFFTFIILIRDPPTVTGQTEPELDPGSVGSGPWISDSTV